MIDTSIYLNVFLTISGLYLGLNLLGLLYSRVVLDKTILEHQVVIPQLSYIYKHKPNSFKKHLPLILMNLMIMVVIFPAGLYLMSDWIIVPYQNFWIVLAQLFAILLIDDFYFYCFHRTLHESKFLYRKIHHLHHRSIYPFPSDYLYEHPLEWMIGLLGPFIAFLIIGGVSFPTIVLFLIIKVLHELDIHSGIKSSFYRHMPFAGTNEYHALHHKYYLVHYASVFSLWDRVFQTNLKIESE